jgi:Cu(I)/Ag(I) efflux system membrane fusion protein
MATNQEDHLLDLDPLPEGVETPPPYVRTMGIIRWVLLIGMSLFALVMILGYFNLSPWASAETTSAQYHCPMHPTYVSSQPGECPICGMNLVPTNSEMNSAKPSKDTSSMAEEPAPNTKAKPGQYYCPMDPEVVSDTMGRCPVCGMKLLLLKEKSEPEPNMGVPSNVPGLVEVTIDEPRLQLIGLKTGTVSRQSLASGLSVVGYVAADETKQSSIQTRTSGWVKKLFIDQTGQTVTAGQPLLTLYSQDIYQAQQDFLSALDAAGHADIDQSLTRVRMDMVNATRERLRLLGLDDKEIGRIEKERKGSAEVTLNSPYSGIVLQKNVTAGQTVSPDQVLLTLADLRQVWFVADLYEQDIANIKIGQDVQIEFASAGIARQGIVAFIYPTISSETRTAKVRIELLNSDLSLRPGMYGKATIAHTGAEVLAVSSEAVLDGGKTKYVFVVHDKTHFEPRLVTVGRSSDDWIEIISGLKDGEVVVTSANFLIDSESRLKAAITGMGGTSNHEQPSHTH